MIKSREMPGYKKIVAAAFFLCSLVYYFLFFSDYALSLQESAGKIKQLYPHLGPFWISIRNMIRPTLIVSLVFCLLYLSAPLLAFSFSLIWIRRREVLVSIGAVLITFIIAEIVLRIYGFIPGQIDNQNCFHPVDKLVLQDAYLADENGMTYIDPKVSEELKSFLKADFNTKQQIETAVALSKSKWKNIGYDFRALREDYALVISQLEKSPFMRYYSSVLSDQHQNSFDSLILSYVRSPINSYGFRSIAFRKKSDKKRILLIGDSFTYGYTTTNKVRSFYDLLLSQGMEVYNTGLNDSDPSQYESVARKFVPLIKPDIVIVNFYLGNDVQYYRQQFGPYQTYNYRTNAGYLQVCPLGVPTGNMNEAYAYAMESSFIPTDSSAFNEVCSRTVITTLLWNLSKHSLHFKTKSKKIAEFDAKVKQYQLDSPDANERLCVISKLCEENGSTLILSIIPALSPDGKRNLVYANSDKKLFPNQTYFEPHTLDQTDYCTGGDMHFNDKGHEKYAAFLKSIIDTISIKRNQPVLPKPE